MYVCIRVSFRKMGKGGQNNTYEKHGGGGGKGSARDSAPSRGVWGHFEFIPSEVHFQTHLWFSNDMMR